MAITAKLCTNRILARLGELQPKKMLFLQVFLLNTLFSNKIYFPNIAASSCAGCGTRCEFHNTPQFMHQVIHNACGQDAHIEWENTIKLLGYTRYRSHVGSDVLRFWHTENSRVSIRAPAWGATSCTSTGWWRRWFQFVPSRVGDVVRCAALRTVRRSRNRPLDAFALWAELPIVVSMSAIVS